MYRKSTLARTPANATRPTMSSTTYRDCTTRCLQRLGRVIAFFALPPEVRCVIYTDLS